MLGQGGLGLGGLEMWYLVVVVVIGRGGGGGCHGGGRVIVGVLPHYEDTALNGALAGVKLPSAATMPSWVDRKAPSVDLPMWFIALWCRSRRARLHRAWSAG